ncbi:MAG: hypothetical protein ACJ72H_10530 [Candidatus Sulfotelmatobacter sp.]
MEKREVWWHDKLQRGQSLCEEIKALAERARAAGFETTEYILDLALAELRKDIEKEQKNLRSHRP